MTDYPTMQQQCRLEPFDAVRWQARLLLEKRRRWLTSSQTKLDKFDGVNVGLTLSPAREALPYLLGVDRAALRRMREDLTVGKPGLADWIRRTGDFTPRGVGSTSAPSGRHVRGRRLRARSLVSGRVARAGCSRPRSPASAGRSRITWRQP